MGIKLKPLRNNRYNVGTEMKLRECHQQTRGYVYEDYLRTDVRHLSMSHVLLYFDRDFIECKLCCNVIHDQKLGCSHAIFALLQCVEYFVSRGSTVFMAALDARKILIESTISNCFI